MQIPNHLTHPIEIYKITTQPITVPEEKKPFHELIYIHQGNGVLIKDGITNVFSGGTAFVINKGTHITFEATRQTTLYMVRFTEDVKLVLKDLIKTSGGKAIPPLRAKSTMHPKIQISENDTTFLKAHFELLYTLQTDTFHNTNLMYYQMLCIITIVERNIPIQPNSVEKGIPEPGIQPIIRYIHKNLRTPELLQLTRIAHTFHVSYNSLCAFFKKEMNLSAKQYIIECRMQAIEKRVTQSRQSFKEIAHEFGFTDESHFYKSFKKHFSISPSEYRKKVY